MKIFGREPAVITAFIASAIAVFSSFIFPLSDTQQGVLNAADLAIFGFIAAALVAKEKLLPAITGLAKALIAVAISFGLHWSPEQQGLILSIIATGAALLGVRPQVVASVPPEEAP
jgi:hypothetical protein